MKKLTNKKGFTLMEMLIVVAIIAVLVAIAIPVFNGALTKSKEAADVANIRAAYAEWQVAILTDNKAIPTDEEGFLAKIPDSAKLNYNKGDADKLTYTYDTTKKVGTITYSASKLTDDTGTNKTFTWTLSNAEIN